MAWTDKQKAFAISTCKKHGIDDDTRKFILRQFPNSKFDRDGHATDEPSFTSAKLTNADFDAFMDHIDRQGRDPNHRSRWLVKRIANTLEVTHDQQGKPLLEPDGVGLQGWIDKRIRAGARLENLTSAELHALIESLKAYGRRHGVVWTGGKRQGKTLGHRLAR